MLQSYKYVEETVSAVQSTPENQQTILKILGAAATNDLLYMFQYTYNAGTQTYDITFRYKTGTVNLVLNSGDYLVELNSGLCTVMTKEEFESQYVNTSIDPIIPPTEQQSPSQALVAFIKKWYPQAGINSEDDLTPENMAAIGEGLKTWYDSEKDVFDIKFTDCGIVDPTGLRTLLNKFPTMSFIKDTTSFTLNFNNGAGDGYPNQFNRIALETLIGELRKIDSAAIRKLVGITFIGLKERAVIPPSVTDTIWEQFRTDAMAVTGITMRDAIKRI